MGKRLVRRVALVCGAMALVAIVAWPERPRLALGVVGGGVLVGLAVWALSGMVDGLTAAPGTAGRRRTGGAALVKFFTRHAILALAAYGMMVRLHLDPIGMIVGVTSVVVAAAFEAARPR